MLVFSWALLTLSLVLCAKAEVRKRVGTRIPPTTTVKLGFESVRWKRWPPGTISEARSHQTGVFLVSFLMSKFQDAGLFGPLLDLLTSSLVPLHATVGNIGR